LDSVIGVRVWAKRIEVGDVRNQGIKRELSLPSDRIKVN
jgi:hypothetical protein